VRDVYGRLPAVESAHRRALRGETVTDVIEVGDVVFEVVFSPGQGGHAVTGLATDVTARHRSERELAHAATHDTLTGLLNRRGLAQRLQDSVEKARRDRRGVALINLDVDDFKAINDALGHEAGDELIRQLAIRLGSRVGTDYALARHGGDEFMLVLDDAPGDGRALAEAVAAELLGVLRTPFRVAGAELQMGASVGISLFPTDADDAIDLFKHADAAMYQAKSASRGGHAIYDPAADTAPRSPARSSSSTTSRSTTSRRPGRSRSRR
jgi:diguanylate cyclase (GGDEF)-like protein